MKMTPTRQEVEAFGRAISEYLSNHVSKLDGFNWPIGKKCVETAISLDLLSEEPVDGGFAETMRLRSAVAMRARDIQARSSAGIRIQALGNLARFVITDWGGVRNGEGTIEEFARRFTAMDRAFDQITSVAHLTDAVDTRKRGDLFNLKGIASWSKWISFVWSDWALIYDARIAFALNVIHFLHGVDAPVFPVPTGRNTWLSALDAESSAAFAWLGKRIEVRPGQKELVQAMTDALVSKQLTYTYYLDVMEAAHKHLWSQRNTPLLHTEMLLFSLSTGEIADDFAWAMLQRLQQLPTAPVRASPGV